MFVYVDEYGNITSTPPDPTKKTKINVEDIAISTAKYEANPEDLIKSGIVNFTIQIKVLVSFVISKHRIKYFSTLMV